MDHLNELNLTELMMLKRSIVADLRKVKPTQPAFARTRSNLELVTTRIARVRSGHGNVKH